jgi:hypothetical protein
MVALMVAQEGLEVENVVEHLCLVFVVVVVAAAVAV